MRRAFALILILFLLLPALAAAAPPPSPQLLFQVPEGWSTAAITPDQQAALGKAKKALEGDLSLELVVTGYTDTMGDPKENLAIGFYYAERVVRQVVGWGIPRARLRVATEGEASPLVTTGGFDAQAPNRRVTLSLEASVARGLATPASTAFTGKKVFITEPMAGTTDRGYQKVRALVEGGAKTALLTVNGVSSILPVANSRLEGEAVLERGPNVIEVTAWDDTGASGKDRVELEYLPPPPQIIIETPLDEQTFNTTESPVIRVRGRVDSAIPLKETFLFLNGAPRRIFVEQDGTFSQPIVLIQESNALRVEALDIYGKVATSPEITVRSETLAPKDLVVFLTWDKNGVDVDLHALGPAGKHTYFGALDPFHSPDGIPGGALDIDNKAGFGPEVFSLAEGPKGAYSFEARYHHSPTSEPCQALVTVVLHPGDPARRMVRVFGPYPLSPGEGDTWRVTSIRMPEGLFEEP